MTMQSEEWNGINCGKQDVPQCAFEKPFIDVNIIITTNGTI